MPLDDQPLRDPAVLKVVREKLDRKLPLSLSERLALNFHLASEVAKNIRKETDALRHRNDRVVSYTQGDFEATRLAFEMVIMTVYSLAANQADKRQALEAEVLKLCSRVIDLEERSVTGTYDGTKSYRAGDVVALNGASFTAKRGNPGPCPGDGWQLTAARGKTGKHGPRVKSLTVDGQGMLTLTNADGSTVKCDLYPVLAKVQQA